MARSFFDPQRRRQTRVALSTLPGYVTCDCVEPRECFHYMPLGDCILVGRNIGRNCRR